VTLAIIIVTDIYVFKQKLGSHFWKCHKT
jgi:hypothetical protein